MKLSSHNIPFLALLVISGLCTSNLKAQVAITVSEGFDQTWSTTSPPLTPGTGGGQWKAYRNINSGTNWNSAMAFNSQIPSIPTKSGSGMAGHPANQQSNAGGVLETPIVDWSLRGGDFPKIKMWVYRDSYNNTTVYQNNIDIRLSTTSGTQGGTTLPSGTVVARVPANYTKVVATFDGWVQVANDDGQPQGPSTTTTAGWYEYTFQMTGSTTVTNNYTSLYIEFCAGVVGYNGYSAAYSHYMDEVSWGTYILGCPQPCTKWLNPNCTLCPTGCYIDGGTVVPVVSLQTASTATTSANYGYVYWTFNAVKDSSYYFDLCSSTGTAGISWLRLHTDRHAGNGYCLDASSTPTLLMQNNQNGCAGNGTGLSKLIWTCQSSGIYYLESAISTTPTYWGASGNQAAILSYKTLPSFSYTCSDAFYDKGIDGTNGVSSSYNNNEDWIYTYYPVDTVAQAISVQFTSFSTSPGDILCVYDGNSINAPLIGCYSGPSITGAFSSSASDGSLTFHFTSDDSLISNGWQANVSCVDNVGVKNDGSVNNINVYPNPAKDQIVVSGLEFKIGATLEVYNALGGKVYSKLVSAKLERINSKQFVQGIYFVKIKAEKELNIKKIIKE